MLCLCNAFLTMNNPERYPYYVAIVLLNRGMPIYDVVKTAELSISEVEQLAIKIKQDGIKECLSQYVYFRQITAEELARTDEYKPDCCS